MSQQARFNEKKAEGKERKAGRIIRVLLAKGGLDGHDRGVLVIAQALRDAGMEVIYTGLRQSTNAIIRSAIQEDVDVVAVSVLSGAHMALLPAIRKGLNQFRRRDILLTGGDIIPEDDRKLLAKLGIGKIFGPGDSIQEIIRYIRVSVRLSGILPKCPLNRPSRVKPEADARPIF
jgi:methylmalonyl-CoA mutase C-terminal domain/subunit